ncbi:TPA: prepilin-type N-terminal cleavage/methylation domain-containing protein [Escherichia coli]|nr:prepilin-type N-terminal cleavage/methylation domain-containing protein [Escherichia coli]
MKTQRGYTLIETLVAMLILVMLSASGLYGWQYWQQSQRLWQTASQARDYLLYLREDANRMQTSQAGCVSISVTLVSPGGREGEMTRLHCPNRQ